jgi:hypothetical protein
MNKEIVAIDKLLDVLRIIVEFDAWREAFFPDDSFAETWSIFREIVEGLLMCHRTHVLDDCLYYDVTFVIEI